MMKHHIDETISIPIRPLEKMNFQSMSEYACAKMLEKYTGWKAMDGVTFQILVGRAIFDFRVGHTFVEYHPISLRQEFITSALNDVMSACNELDRSRKAKILRAIAEELSAQYAKRRGQTLAAHPSYGAMELICVNSAEDFITKVVYRFAEHRCPPVGEMLKEFRSLQRSKKFLRNN